MKKNTKMALVATGAGLSLLVGGVGVASAVGTSPHATKISGVARLGFGVGSPFQHVLSVLVANGTITQAQSDAIVKEATAERTAQDSTRSAERTVHETLIATTIGVDWPTIQKRLQSGESLATIAGSKSSDLITVMVNEASTRIDAAVAAGRITSAQATTLKANLQARITAAVNSTGHEGRMLGGFEGLMGDSDMDAHHGPNGFMGGPGARDHHGPNGFMGGPGARDHQGMSGFMGGSMGGFGGSTAPAA
jgi:polyhydroxyalkanoate synthesis regulator phasin